MDATTAVNSGDPAAIRRLESSIRAAELAPDWAPTDEQAAQILRLLLAAYTRALRTNEAVELQVRSGVADIKEHIDQNAARTSDVEFNASLRFFAPPSATSARELRPVWVPLERLVQEHAASADRAQLIRDWAATRPAWMADAPAPVLLWLAGVAEDNGLTGPSSTLIDDALARGASPAAFWRLRRALLSAPETAAEQIMALEALVDEHPLKATILAFLQVDAPGALTHLGGWTPASPAERSFTDFLTTQFLVGAGDFDAAARVANECLTRGQHGPAQFVADRLLERGSPRTAPFHFAQLQQCYELAIRVRQTVRAWHGPSRGAVVTAMRAAESLGDWERAWSLSQAEPAGEATSFEAAGEKVREHALLIAAEERPLPEVEAMLAEAPDTPRTVQARALVAERRGENERAMTHWREASTRKVEAVDLLRIGFQLARHGEYAYSLDALEERLPAEVQELRLLSLLATGEPGALETLRGSARTSRALTFGLISHFQRSGEHGQAARMAADGAEQWSDGELWLIAARQFLVIDAYAEAAAAARAAARHSFMSGSEGLIAHLLLIEALTGDGKWSEATDAAATAMAHHPKEPGAVWALVVCQLHLGRKESAWETYAAFGGRPEPRTAHEASVRIRLWREFERSESSLDVVFTLMDKWRESQQVQLASAYALLLWSGELSDEAGEQVRQRLSTLFTALPDVFVQQRFDEDNVIDWLNGLVARLPDTSVPDRQVMDGELPFGMLASVHHRSLTEVLVGRTTALFADDAQAFEREVVDARMARSGSIVVDITALVSLSFFDESLAAQLRGFAGSVSAPLLQRLDAVRAVDRFGDLSTMTVGRAPDGTATVHELTEDEATAHLRRASIVLGHFDAVKCVERTWPPRLPELASHLDKFLWAESLDLAFSMSPQALWVDDAKIRQLAKELGVPTFGTAALIEAMRREGVLSDDVATHLRAVLITHNYVGGRWEPEIVHAAADLDGWLPRGVAHFIAWGPADDPAYQRLQFAHEALRRCVADPEALQSWTVVIAHWLVRVGGDAAGQNLVVLLQSLLQQEWVTAAQLPFLLAGIRSVTTARDVPDPLERALELHYRTLRATLEPQLASAFVTGLLSLAPDNDRTTATRIIFAI